MDLSSAVTEYEAPTQMLLETARCVNEDRIDHRVPGGWSARQIIHHVADSETQSFVRLRRLIAEPEGSLIQGYDEAAWARTTCVGPSARSCALRRQRRAVAVGRSSCPGRATLGSVRASPTCAGWRRAR